ncbi:MAG: ROK family protein [Limnochordia bacterium]
MQELSSTDRIYDGAAGGAGEFGHTTVEPAGAPCKCGNRGCLGVMAAEPAMISRAIQMLTIGAQTKIRDYHQGAPAEISLESLVLAARDYDPVALSIINDCLDYLAIGIANLINLFSPAAIILGGSTMETLHPMGI